ncbi:hypothetical protein LZD49_00005 [Dyadobacter sp. CY261]|uniref:hypothetical protein n=1 Tax=Dyadobacter sp. CY261 TaxID=2907203 RepID=UPI001F448EE2|nr:hypothetical protein [Dyadobacter sp. CY261]MCF0068828.1 hypothetical protein [Dyadobacter sp. CY261]
MRLILNAPFYGILLLCFLSSCSKDEQDCGCDGSTRRIFENVQARYVGEGMFVVPDTMAGFLRLYPCDVDTTWEVSEDRNTWNYTISGNLKKYCPGPNPELELPYGGGKIQLTNIKKM